MYCQTTQWHCTNQISVVVVDQHSSEMRPTNSGKGPLEPDGDDEMVCCLEVCDELHDGTSYVANGDEDFTDEMTGATLLRDDVAKARAEDIAWHDKFEAYVEVTDITCL